MSCQIIPIRAANQNPILIPVPSRRERRQQLKMEVENFRQEIIQICLNQKQVLDLANDLKKEMDYLDGKKQAYQKRMDEADREWLVLLGYDT